MVNFALNRAITFRHAKAPLVRAFLRYCLVAAAGLAVNYAVYSLCVVLWPLAGFVGDAGDPAAVRRRRQRRGDGRSTFVGFRWFAFRPERVRPLASARRRVMMARTLGESRHDDLALRPATSIAIPPISSR